MNKKVDTKKEQPKKKKLRRADLENAGRLHIPDEYKEDGYHLRIVDADKPGQIERLKNLGYEIVTKDLSVGNNSVDTPHSVGSAVEVEIGIRKHRQGIVMRISNEDREEILKLKKEKADEQDAMLGNTGIPKEFQTGDVKRTNN